MQFTDNEILAKAHLCIALDSLDSIDDVRSRVEELKDYCGMFKVGKELFTKFGPEVVKVVRSIGCDIFLDLKFHDIPNTVHEASSAVSQMGVSMFTVHASGGSEMLRATMLGAKEGATRAGVKTPRVVGVTILTSIDEKLMNEMGVPGKLSHQVLRLAKRCEDAGLDGIVCSADDLKDLKSHFADSFLFVTPGIKGSHSNAGHDQKRVMTACNAIKAGAGLLVVGRAVTAHKTAVERREAALEILREIALDKSTQCI